MENNEQNTPKVPQTQKEAKSDAEMSAQAPQTSGFKRRMVAIGVLVFIILLFFIARLVQFQLIEGDKYASEAAKGNITSSQTVSINANIL
ncbi:MAG: hypothetical protein ACK5JF_06765 [Oscillospiraceae bacterium]